MRRRRSAALAACAIGLAAATAGADLYRCRRPDGRIVYTDSRATCPGAREHRPTGSVQKVSPTPPPAPQAGRRARSARSDPGDR